MKYVLRLKSNNERVLAHDAASLEEAKQHFMLTKQMDEATFDSMFIVKEYMIEELSQDTAPYRNSTRYRQKFNQKRSRYRRLRNKFDKNKDS